MIDKVLPITKLKKDRTAQLIAELYWDHDRLSTAGQATLDDLAKLWGVPTDEDLINGHSSDLPSDVEPKDG